MLSTRRQSSVTLHEGDTISVSHTDYLMREMGNETAKIANGKH